jgi:calcium-dependent protein kinase
MRRELDILKSLDHPNIIKFYETYQDDHYLYFVMEYCAGGELLERLVQRKSLLEKNVSPIIFKVFSALNYLHRNKICHRDIKLENVLFKDKENSDIKLIDFGLSVKVSEMEEGKGKTVGTPLYLAPEILKGYYKESCDIWSVGVMTYILLSGAPPFVDKSETKLFEKISVGKFVFDGDVWQGVSKQAKELISKCLVINPKKRITAAHALKHHWFKHINDQITLNKSMSNVDQDIIENLRNFKPATKLKKEVLKVLVNHMNEKEVKTLRDSFLVIDKDQTGNF